MKNTRKLVLTDGSGVYIREDKENFTVQETKDINQATDYRFNLFGYLSKKHAEQKFSKVYQFKNIIAITEWNINVEEQLKVLSNSSSKQKLEHEDIMIFITAILIFIGLVNEQGLFTAIALFAIIIKLYLKDENETN